MGDTDFYDAVGDRGRLDAAAADEATLVTLRVLGDHLADTVVADLTGPLPDESADEFAAGAADPPSSISYEEFLERVADRLDVDHGEAERRARAVGATLAARADDEALTSARAQLPDAYDRLFWVPSADEILDRVQAAGDLDSANTAREATTAVLAALGERLTPGEAGALAAYLPEEFATALDPAEDVPPGATDGAPSPPDVDTDAVAADYDVEEFVARVAELEGVDQDRAREHVGLVTDALAEAVPPREFEDALDQLPQAYGTIL